MRQRALLVAVFLVFGLVSCTPVALKQVRQGLETTIAHLPQSDDFVFVAIMSGEGYDDPGGEMCYSAGAQVAVGTWLTREDALEDYLRKLEAQGWVLVRDDYPDEKQLVRGKYEKVTVDILAPGWQMELDKDFVRARSIYPAFVFLLVDYYLPSREACLGPL